MSWMYPQIPGSPKSQIPNQVPDSFWGFQMLLGAGGWLPLESWMMLGACCPAVYQKPPWVLDVCLPDVPKVPAGLGMW